METAQEHKCVFCKETFDSKEELQIHFRKHGDPKFHPSPKHKFWTHNDTGSDKSNDANEMVNCDVCSAVFPTISKAITHKHKVHPEHDAKYFCPWCGKLFTMKHLFNKHMKLSHESMDNSESADFHCDCCDVTFHVPSAMLYHNKFFHRQDTDLPTIGQSKKLKMINQEAVQIYYCSFCGEEYNNKVNLHKHMGDDHSDENQSPDDVMRCPLCDAIFYHLDAYELHLTFHSIEDTYTEKSNMVDTITEFSLETVPPIMERVENCEPTGPLDPEVMGIEDFLQIAMDNPIDEDNPKVKSKKHKKHKKSKKNAITLDEFLSMNKDFFGEGLDFQGIEEVPSRVVAKRLKVKKQPEVSKTGSKRMSPKEIEKLRKQGIVIKKKTNKKSAPKKISVTSKPIQHSDGPTSNEIKSNIPATTNISTSSEVLSKLLNQSNSQIKIVRKSAQENVEQSMSGDEQHEYQPPPDDNADECDFSLKMKSPDPGIDNKISSNEQLIHDEDKLPCHNNDTETNYAVHNKLSDIKETDRKLKSDSSLKSSRETKCNNEGNTENIHNYVDDARSNELKEMITNYSNSLSALRNVRTQLTVKPVISKSNVTAPSAEDKIIKDVPENTSPKNVLALKCTEKAEFKEKSINALKHLSHLTVKSVNNIKMSAPMPPVLGENEEHDIEPPEKMRAVALGGEENTEDTETMVNVSSKIKNNRDTKVCSMTSLKALKGISKNITIKSLNQAASPSESIAPNYEEDHHADDMLDDEDISNIINKNERDKFQNKHQGLLKIEQPEKNTAATKSPMKSPTLSPKVTITSQDSIKAQSNTNLLKQLTNITAKSIGNASNTQVTINKSSSQSSSTAISRMSPNHFYKEGINKNIEIFNIDDSESDNEDHTQRSGESRCNSQPHIQTKFAAPRPIDALKGLSKHITVKSTNQQTTQNLIKLERRESAERDLPNDDSDEDYSEITNKNKFVHSVNNKNKALQSTLKNLSRHLTIKSRNSSPSSTVTFQEQNTDHSNDPESDSDSNPGRVKITEINDDYESKEQNNSINDNVIIQPPHDSGSDNDDFFHGEAEDDEYSDIESKIKANTLKKTSQNIKPSNNNLKNIGNDVTIRSHNERKSQSDLPPVAIRNTQLPSNLSNELAIKPYKQGNKVSQEKNETTLNRNNKIMAQQTVRQQSTNQSMNQKTANASNQTNTVNKEVTVKTFQTKTVIQEITTTVTKTIKTVNQTMKQEVQTTNQSCTAVTPQKVQGMRPSPPLTKNYKGVVVRHATPVMGTKVRNAMAPIRPAPSVKNANQLVPIRPGLNLRPNNPRMPIVKNNVPSTSSANNTGKPIKMSPNVSNMMSKKRAQETSGPFSCFKKPKASLIPEPEISNLPTGECGDAIYFASSSQMTKSNVMNMTKSVKGNTLVSSTQMKTEISTSSQQLSRLSNMSGLKVVKTSQAKQTAHVEEQQEMDVAKQTTLAAIEKLQKQGLLVKKPRLEANVDSDHSEDGDFDTFAPEDNDDDYDE